MQKQPELWEDYHKDVAKIYGDDVRAMDDWQEAIVQAEDILKAKGRILIADYASSWQNRHKKENALDITELKKLAEDLDINFKQRKEGQYIFFELTKR